ncbi:MAG: hypothetical protein LBB34_03675 [Holosporales bacterium]|jgi:hypothetical protein|nr:hypothetical protein [Holosporales bacterium]
MTFSGKTVIEVDAIELYAEGSNGTCENKNGSGCTNGTVCDIPIIVNSAVCSSK